MHENVTKTILFWELFCAIINKDSLQNKIVFVNLKFWLAVPISTVINIKLISKLDKQNENNLQPCWSTVIVFLFKRDSYLSGISAESSALIYEYANMFWQQWTVTENKLDSLIHD